MYNSFPELNEVKSGYAVLAEEELRLSNGKRPN